MCLIKSCFRIRRHPWSGLVLLGQTLSDLVKPYLIWSNLIWLGHILYLWNIHILYLWNIHILSLWNIHILSLWNIHILHLKNIHCIYRKHIIYIPETCIFMKNSDFSTNFWTKSKFSTFSKYVPMTSLSFPMMKIESQTGF